MSVCTTLQGKSLGKRVFVKTVVSHLRIIRDKLAAFTFRGKSGQLSQYSEQTAGSYIRGSNPGRCEKHESP